MVKYSSLVFSMAVIGQANSLRGEQSQRILQPNKDRVCPFDDKAALEGAIAKYLGGTWASDQCTGVKKNGNAITATCPVVYGETMNDWDVSLITDFSSLFSSFKLKVDFNEDIGQWDVGNGLYFNEMFENAHAFNQDIGNWDVGNGNNFDKMFSGAFVFNQDIGKWNVAKGERFDLSGWTIQSDALVRNMFGGSPMGSYVPGRGTPCQIDEDNLYYIRANQICEAWDGDNIGAPNKGRVCPTIKTIFIKNDGCSCDASCFYRHASDCCGETCGCPVVKLVDVLD